MVIDAVELRAEMELELNWRESELRFMENQGSLLPETDGDRYRRALVLLVYAHMEGFSKAALSTYASHVNSAHYKIGDVNWAMAAASLALVFRRLRDNDVNSKLFRRTLPNDAKLHRFCRERDFLEQLEEFEAGDVDIEIDEIVDLESNLKPVVLRKVLYRLGLDTALADRWQDDMNLLLEYRNNIAHGATKRNVERKVYERLRGAASSVCNGLMLAVFNAARDGAHLRT